MKNILLIVFASTVLLASCVKENTPEIPLNDTVDTTMAMSGERGTFINGPYGSVSGMATVYTKDGSLVLALENMMISNGPQLHVYLSKEVQPVNFIDLGALQSTRGNQLYTITGNPDFSQYKYALIHCKKYNHLFGSANLQ
ncbi:MAG TPA: DM13 domain-containing protein [Chitinophagaceae bacterium]|nr:DM13 domain-containing protein [Chitinophagaceae bacterium]